MSECLQRFFPLDTFVPSCSREIEIERNCFVWLTKSNNVFQDCWKKSVCLVTKRTKQNGWVVFAPIFDFLFCLLFLSFPVLRSNIISLLPLYFESHSFSSFFVVLLHFTSPWIMFLNKLQLLSDFIGVVFFLFPQLLFGISFPLFLSFCLSKLSFKYFSLSSTLFVIRPPFWEQFPLNLQNNELVITSQYRKQTSSLQTLNDTFVDFMASNYWCSVNDLN